MPNENAAEKLSIEFTPEFKRNIRHLSKKYRHIKSDINFVIEKLKAGETPGNRIPAVGFVVYKLRVKNSDIPKGKSGGYRLIYLVIQKKIILVTIYSKTEQGDISISKIRKIIKNTELK